MKELWSYSIDSYWVLPEVRPGSGDFEYRIKFGSRDIGMPFNDHTFAFDMAEALNLGRQSRKDHNNNA